MSHERSAVELIVGQGLRGEDQQRGVAPVFDHGLDDRHLVAERLAGSGPGRDRDARPFPEPVDRGGLVGIEAFYAAGGDPARDFGREWYRQICEFGLPGRKDLAVHEPAGELGVGGERIECGARVHLRRGYRSGATRSGSRLLRPRTLS